MKCICCNKSINPLHTDLSHEEAVFKTEKGKNSQIKAENRMWSDGVVGNISAGFGSVLDGGMFVIAVCDDCIREKVESGVIAYTGNYMFGTPSVSEEIDRCRKIWRRSNNIEDLLS